MLRLVNNPIDTSYNIISFDFLQNVYVELLVNEFKNIKIQIIVVSGKTIKCKSDIATRNKFMKMNGKNITMNLSNFKLSIENGKLCKF